MNRRFPIALAAILAVAAFAAIAFAWAGEHRKDLRLTGGDGWPDGLADLVNYDGRVRGFFINTSDYFFYAGEAKALNTFLERYAALKGVPLTLVLHPGRGEESGAALDHRADDGPLHARTHRG